MQDAGALVHGQAELFALFSEIRPDPIRFLQRRTGNADSAADLVQDIFVKLTTIRAILPDRQQARAYIYRMAANVATDRHRVDARRVEIMSGADILFEDAPPPDPAGARPRHLWPGLQHRHAAAVPGLFRGGVPCRFRDKL